MKISQDSELLLALQASGALEWWQSAVFVVALAVVAVLSLIIAAIQLRFVFSPRPVSKEIRYAIQSVSLVSPDVASTGLEIRTEDGTQVMQVTATTITISNACKSTIAGTELLPGRSNMPPGLALDLSTFGDLSFTSISASGSNVGHIDPSIGGFDVKNDEILPVGFNALHPGESFQISIVHDGPEIESTELLGVLPDGRIVETTSASVATTIEVIRLPLIGSIRMEESEVVFETFFGRFRSKIR